MAKGVTWFEARKTWKAKVGCKRSPSGARTPAVFYFGPDERAALTEAAASRARWRFLKLGGVDSWPLGEPNRQAIQVALGIAPGAVLGLEGPEIASRPAKAPEARAGELVAADALTVDQATRLFLAAKLPTMKRRWAMDLRKRLLAALDSLGRSRPLRELGQTELEAFAHHWQKRPLKRTKGGKTSTERVSDLYARHVVAATRSFLTYCFEHADIQWDKPRAFESILTVRDLTPASTSFEDEETRVQRRRKRSE